MSQRSGIMASVTIPPMFHRSAGLAGTVIQHGH
jgi:hypothetical protein